MATVNFYVGEGSNVNNTAGSGIGFFGTGGFGTSIPVGSYQDSCFVTDSTGTSQNIQIDCNKYINSSGVQLNGAGTITLREVPNYLATLNIRFTHTSSVQVQNVYLYGSDRVSKNNSPSGVRLQVAEIVHPTLTQTNSGSGSQYWVPLSGSVSKLTMFGGLGPSGNGINGPFTSSTWHDWFCSLSATPLSVGSKLFQLVWEAEYL